MKLIDKVFKRPAASTLAAQIERAEREVAAAETALDQLDAEATDLACGDDEAAYSAAAEKVQRARADLDARREKLARVKKSHRDQVNQERDNRIAQIQADLVKLQEARRQTIREVNAATEAEKARHKAAIESLDARTAAADKAIRVAESELAGLRRDAAAARAELARENGERIGVLRDVLTRIQAEHTRLYGELERIHGHMAPVMLANLRESPQGHPSEIRGLEQTIARNNARSEEINARLAELSAQSSAIQGELTVLGG